MKQHIDRLSQSVRKLPTPMAGLALGIGGLGMCLDAALVQQGRIETVSMLIVGAMLLSLLLRFVLHFDTLREDLKHPVIGSVAPTFAMAMMVFSHGVSMYWPLGGTVIWLLAITLHVYFLIKFINHRRREFSLHHMVPSWFVPPVGIAVAAVAWSGAMGDWTHLIAWLCMAFALACYAVMMPLMFYRLMFRETIPEGAQPTIAILAAPASLTLAAYLRVTMDPSPLLVIVMLGLAITMTVIVYGAFLHLLRLPFTPGFAAFTFPMAIGATAIYKVEAAFLNWRVPMSLIEQIDLLAEIELSIATVVIAYVAFRYVLFALSRPAT